MSLSLSIRYPLYRLELDPFNPNANLSPNPNPNPTPMLSYPIQVLELDPLNPDALVQVGLKVSSL